MPSSGDATAEEAYKDRLAVDYRIEALMPDGSWRLVAASTDRTSLEQKANDRPNGEDSRSGWLNCEANWRRLRAVSPSLWNDRVVYAGRFEPAPQAFRLHRGEAMQKREPVSPSAVHSLEPEFQLSGETPEQARRIAFADWLGDPRNPLVARVLVNRLWQHHFGEGLVSTPNDFGRNGAKPSHPEMLDWLAGEFVRSGWSIKHMQKLIVMSNCWQQSSLPNADGLDKDAQSRLLWRYPPRRLEAEVIRDNMLAVAGTLDSRMGGPGIQCVCSELQLRPGVQPEGCRMVPTEWRRAIYMTKVRVAQDSTFGAFDCPDAGQPQPKRPRSTTPLQALNLLNSDFVLQQSEYFARRIQSEAGNDAVSQVSCAFRFALQRDPDARKRHRSLNHSSASTVSLRSAGRW